MGEFHQAGVRTHVLQLLVYGPGASPKASGSGVSFGQEGAQGFQHGERGYGAAVCVARVPKQVVSEDCW